MRDVQPVFSIITVTYNAGAWLEGTIKSVLAQKNADIEYIIIDGGSTDNTLDIIKKYEPKLSKWISEPDQGLYDAMNKSFTLATGDFIWFLNAGDRIFAHDTVEKMVKKWTPQTDILYGEVMLVNEQRQPIGTRSERTTQQLPDHLHWRSLRKGMVVCHQAFVPRRTLAPTYIPDNLSADIDWVIRCLKKASVVTHTHLILAEYLMGGISKKRHRAGLTGRYKILKQHYGFLPNLYHHLLIVARAAYFKITGKANY